jgi:hypothetical protein
MSWWWSWLLAAVIVLGLYLTQRRIWWGWIVALGAQVLWVIYAMVTEQYGFLVIALAYAVLFWTNYVVWREKWKLDNHIKKITGQ